MAQNLDQASTCHGSQRPSCHGNGEKLQRFGPYCHNYLALQKPKFLPHPHRPARPSLCIVAPVYPLLLPAPARLNCRAERDTMVKKLIGLSVALASLALLEPTSSSLTRRRGPQVQGVHVAPLRATTT